MRNDLKKLPTLSIGCGTIATLQEKIAEFRSKHILLVVEPNVKDTLLIQSLYNSLHHTKDTVVELYYVSNVKMKLSKGPAYPAIVFKHEYDTIVAIGENDILNYTKMIAHMYKKEEADRTIPTKKALQTILVPLTPTIGAEVNEGIYRYESQIRVMTEDQRYSPELVIYDPVLPAFCTPFIRTKNALYTLIDALETYFLTKKPRPFILSAITLSVKNIVQAKQTDESIEAIEAMLRASMLTGLSQATQRNNSLYDCLVIPIIYKEYVEDSTALATILPHILTLYRSVHEDRGKKLLKQLNLPTSKFGDDFFYLATLLTSLLKELDYPPNLESLGIKKEDLNEMAAMAHALWGEYGDQSIQFELREFELIYKRAFQSGKEFPYN